MSDETAVDVTVVRNDDKSRYDATVGGELAGFADFVDRGDVVVFPHTEVQPRWEGQGVGGQLARFALQDVVDRGRQISPRCSFIAHYVDQHPELRAHVAG